MDNAESVRTPSELPRRNLRGSTYPTGRSSDRDKGGGRSDESEGVGGGELHGSGRTMIVMERTLSGGVRQSTSQVCDVSSRNFTRSGTRFQYLLCRIGHGVVSTLIPHQSTLTPAIGSRSRRVDNDFRPSLSLLLLVIEWSPCLKPRMLVSTTAFKERYIQAERFVQVFTHTVS